MKSLTEEQLDHLSQYGFDELLFENWRKGVREGWYSELNNQIQAELLAPETGTILDSPKTGSPEHEELQSLGLEAIARGELGVVILNGGMATRFGGVVKGTVQVLGSRSFLALRMEDVRRVQQQASVSASIPVYLMNSFATEEDTKKHCRENDNFGLEPNQITHFNQFVSVRMQEDGDLFYTEDNEVSLYGPGHGDFAAAFRKSGCLRRFLACGRKYLFVANVDNLGARISPTILGHHIKNAVQATVEVAPKWPGDIGGSPLMIDGKLQLLEQIRYPKDFDPEIVDVFNTNTFHFSAAALDRDFDLGWYYVRKDVNGKKAVQMERLIGELTRFLDSQYVRVRRTGEENRFFPVKTPEDLEAGREEIAILYPS